MAEYTLKMKAAAYQAFEDGVARFTASGPNNRRITKNNPTSDSFELGEHIEATINQLAFTMKIAGTFRKQGQECPVVAVEDPDSDPEVQILAFYAPGFWFDAGDASFPRTLALSDEEPSIDEINPLVARFFPCTLVDTPTGRRRIEDIAMCDPALVWDAKAVHANRAGRTASDWMRAIHAKWIGRKSVSTRYEPAERLMPARIAPGTLGGGMPHAELTVAPDHAMQVDGVLREVGVPVNGTTKSWVPPSEFGENCTAHHVETETHEIALANGVTAETIVDNVPRSDFDGFAELEELCRDLREMMDLPWERASNAWHFPTRIKVGLRIGAKEESAGQEPADEGESQASPVELRRTCTGCVLEIIHAAWRKPC